MRVVIAGAAGVLGAAVIDRLAREGCRVAAISRRASAGSDTLRHFPCADLSDPTLVSEAMDEAARWLGGLDAVIQVAGAFAWKCIADSVAADWKALFESNVLTTLAVVRVALPYMADGGAIVAVGAASAEPAGAGMSAYAASKSAVARMIESLAVELKGQKIRANLVLPAIIDTPRNRADMPDANPADWTSPEAIAEVIHFLATPAARAINGASVPVTNAA